MTPREPRARLTRRRLLHLTGLGAGAALAGPWRRGGRAAAAAQDGALTIDLAAVIEPAPLRPGAPTTLWRYRAAVTAGDPARLQAVDGPFPGPIVRLREGMTFTADFTNRLREDTTVHWHGLNVPHEMDGHPMDLVAPGAGRRYSYEVRNPAGMYWFHPHPHGRTGAQVYRGLSGLLIVDEAPGDPRLAALPADLAEQPLVLQDRTLDDVNALVYTQSPMGFLGDDLFVNGRERYRATVAPRPYRLRLLNGSNHRIFKLGWRDGAPLTVIGTDGGLLDAPVEKPYVMLGPAERIELLADFGDDAPGTVRHLDTLAFRDDSMAMGFRWPQGGPGEVATFVVDDRPAPPRRRLWLPVGYVRRGPAAAVAAPPPAPNPRDGGATRAAPDAGDARSFAPPAAGAPAVCRVPAAAGSEAAAAGASRWGASASEAAASTPPTALGAAAADGIPADRTIVLRMQAGQFTLNGRTFEHEAVADDEIVTLGADEVWAFVNEGMGGGPGPGPGPGMGMSGPHLMHVHLVRFKVVERTTDGRHAAAYASVAEGLVDEGWKDTVLVMPGETVKIRATFGDFTGLYLVHCHMLEHEDQGIMCNFRVDPPA